MNSNHIRLGAFVLLLVTGILAVGDLTKVFPFLPASYAPLVGIIIVALKEALMAVYSPATNPRTPDNVPPKALLVLLCLGLSCMFGLSGCSSVSTADIKAAITNPANVAQATQDAIGAAATAILANNPSYAAEVAAAGDALQALAASNPAILTVGDIEAVLSKTSLDVKTQGQIAAAVTFAEGRFLSDFTAKLPTLKPTYQLFLTAAGNGLYEATGRPAVPLPAIPAGS